MEKDKRASINPLKLNKATLAQLNDEQLKQIAGGNIPIGNLNNEDGDGVCCMSLAPCMSNNHPA